MSQVYLTSKQVATRFNLAEKTLRKWRSLGKGPPFAKLSAKCIRYRLSAVEAWFSQREMGIDLA